jgi:hypothetical protein
VLKKPGPSPKQDEGMKKGPQETLLAGRDDKIFASGWKVKDYATATQLPRRRRTKVRHWLQVILSIEWQSGAVI